MSAPDPIKWGVTTEESEELRDGTFRTQEKIVNAVARRRAIEELKAMATVLLIMGLRHDGPHLLEIHRRIAAIEAEEA